MILKFLWRLIVFGAGALTVLGALGAIAGLLGVVWPALDLFNHVQLVLLPLTFVGLLLGLAVLRRQPLRGIVVSLAATGFLASVTVTAPEFVAAMAPRPAPLADRPVIRLMTFNIYANNRQLNRVIEPVRAAAPDILVVQEYWFDFRPELDGLFASMFPYSVRCQGGRRAFIALFSKTPFATAPGHACTDRPGEGGRVARISVRLTDSGGRAFTVMTTHLDWPYPSERQMLQMAELSQAASAVPGPLVIAGDFNSTPFSQALRTFTRENGLTRETRLLPTWPAEFFHGSPIDPPLFLPLDQVMVRGGIRVLDVERGASSGGSDHFPVVVDFSID